MAVVLGNLLSKTKVVLMTTGVTVLVVVLYFQEEVFSGSAGPARVCSHLTLLPVSSVSPTLTPTRSAVRLGDLYRPGFAYPSPRLCPAQGVGVRLLFAVISAPEHREARQVIRDTWGRDPAVIAFMVGLPGSLPALEELYREAEEHGDLVINWNRDTYRGLTLKVTAMLEWVLTYCPHSQYLLKVDDDMFVNVPALHQFLDSLPQEGKTIYGRLAVGWQPIRDRASKYFLSHGDFPEPVLPDFTTGPAYLMTSAVPHALYPRALNLTAVPLEDVFFTGVVANLEGVGRVAAPPFTNLGLDMKRWPCSLLQGITFHMVTPAQQRQFWQEVSKPGNHSC